MMFMLGQVVGQFPTVLWVGILTTIGGLVVGILTTRTNRRNNLDNLQMQAAEARAKVIADEVRALALIESGRKDDLRDEVKHLRGEVVDLKSQISSMHDLLIKAAEQRASDRVWRREMLLVLHRCPAVKTAPCPVLALHEEDLALTVAGKPVE